jgi:hypothetical protein
MLENKMNKKRLFLVSALCALSVTLLNCPGNKIDELNEQIAQAQSRVVDSSAELTKVEAKAAIAKYALDKVNHELKPALTNVQIYGSESTKLLTLTQAASAMSKVDPAATNNSNTIAPPPSIIFDATTAAAVPPPPPPPPTLNGKKEIKVDFSKASIQSGTAKNPTPIKTIISNSSSLLFAASDLIAQSSKLKKVDISAVENKKAKDTSLYGQMYESMATKLSEITIEAKEDIRDSMQGASDDEWGDIAVLISSNTDKDAKDSSTKKFDKNDKEVLEVKLNKLTKFANNVDELIKEREEELEILRKELNGYVKQTIEQLNNINTYANKTLAATFKSEPTYASQLNSKGLTSPATIFEIENIKSNNSRDSGNVVFIGQTKNKLAALPISYVKASADAFSNELVKKFDEIKKKFPEEDSRLQAINKALAKREEEKAKQQNDNITDDKLKAAFAKIRTRLDNKYDFKNKIDKKDWSADYSKANKPEETSEFKPEEESDNEPKLTVELLKALIKNQRNNKLLSMQGMDASKGDSITQYILDKIKNGELKYRIAKSFDKKTDVIYYIYDNEKVYYLDNTALVDYDGINNEQKNLGEKEVYFTKEIWDTFTDAQRKMVQDRLIQIAQKNQPTKVDEHVKSNRNSGDKFVVVGEQTAQNNFLTSVPHIRFIKYPGHFFPIKKASTDDQQQEEGQQGNDGAQGTGANENEDSDSDE